MLKITLSTASAIAYLIVAMGMASASDETIGPNGINSAGLTLPNGAPLTGAEISIGQVEPGRPIDPDIDVDAINPFIDPEMVFVKDIEATEGQQDDPHPLHVAGVMISSDVRTGDQLDPPDPYPGTATGVAPLANLYASAAGLTSNAAEDFMIATNHVATRDGNEVWAINFSFGHDPHVGQPDLRDGNSQFTLFVDWSASQHDVLYVSAFGEFPKPPTSFSPTDNFNGITVAASTKANGKYSQVASFNDYAFDAEGDRTSVDLIAPGTDFVLASLGGTRQLAGGLSVPNGTSWAAPHVTGTVALLQQYGDYQIDSVSAPQWTANA